MSGKTSNVGWVSFLNSAHADFSESFKEQFATQLETAFNSKTEIENFAQKRGFQILVGMEDMKLIYKDGYGFGLLEIITPYSESIPQTFFWKSEPLAHAFNQDNLAIENIQIGFCSDFKKEYFKGFKKRKVVRSVKGQTLNFKFIEELDLFPDLTLIIEFDITLEQEHLDKLLLNLKNTLKNAYISEITENEGKYIAMIDFQDTAFTIGKKQIRTFILCINEDLTFQHVKSICFE